MSEVRRSALRIAAIALVTVAACGSSTARVHDSRTFAYSGAALTVEVPSSDLTLTAGTGSGLHVQRWLSGKAAKPGHATWSLTGDTLQLRIDCSGITLSCGSRFQVAVSANVAVTVQGGSNTVTANGLSGGVTVHSNGGEIRLQNLSGPAQVTSGAGNITGTGLRSATLTATANQGKVSGFS